MNNNFWNWFGPFYKNLGGKTTYEKWPEQVVCKHRALIKKLGSDEIRRTISLGEMQIPLDNFVISEFSYKMPAAIRQYYSEYGYYSYDLLKYPTIQHGKFVGMKVSKHMQRWASKHMKDPNQINYLSKTLSELGEQWAKCQIKNYEVEIVLTTKPEAFAMLGHYPPDHKAGSCFRQRGCRNIDKFALGEHPRSFVLLAGKNIDVPNNISGVTSRMWGIADRSINTFYITNQYHSVGSLKGTTLAAIERFFKEVLGQEISKANRVGKFRGIYDNGDDFAISKNPTIKHSGFSITKSSDLRNINK